MTLKQDYFNWPAFAVTLTVRILFWPATIWISVLCIQRGYSLLMLHVVFSVIGCALLLIEATLMVSGDALLVAKVSRSGRITLHWILHIFGLIFLAFGFGLIESHKIRGGLNHFTSDHGIVGLTAYILTFVVAFCAIPTVATRLLPRKLSLDNYKFAHIFAGMAALILLWASLILGLYSDWWQGSELFTTLSIIGYVIGGFILLMKPSCNTLSRTFG